MYSAITVMPAQPSPSRLEAFSDGVIAVIITIMVLDLKVPRETGMAGFATTLPTLAVYAQSFAFTGIYWVNHHHLVDRLKRVDNLILWTNLILLFSLSLLPFFTNYLIDKRMDSFSVALYASLLLVTGFSFTLLQWAIGRHLCRYKTADDPVEKQLQVAEQRKAYLSLAMYLLAVALAFWRPWVALVDAALVTVIWIIPTFGIEHRHLMDSRVEE
jgi:uncharacterized membrane protein